MSMTNTQYFITIIIIMAGTMLTRYLPFILFRPGKEIPSYVRYLGSVLPFAAIALLVIYCLSDIKLPDYSQILSKAAAVLSVYLIHKAKKNTLLSILVGTLVYMVFVQYIY